MTHPTDPVRLKTTDGQEREFLLTRAALKRIRTALNVRTLPEVLAKVSQDEDGAMGVMLFECLVNKAGVTLEQFEELMPFHVERDQETVARILGVSLPDKSDRPTTAPPTAIQ